MPRNNKRKKNNNRNKNNNQNQKNELIEEVTTSISTTANKESDDEPKKLRDLTENIIADATTLRQNHNDEEPQIPSQNKIETNSNSQPSTSLASQAQLQPEINDPNKSVPEGNSSIPIQCSEGQTKKITLIVKTIQYDDQNKKNINCAAQDKTLSHFDNTHAQSTTNEIESNVTSPITEFEGHHSAAYQLETASSGESIINLSKKLIAMESDNYRVESPQIDQKSPSRNPPQALGAIKKSRSLDDNEITIQEISDISDSYNNSNDNIPIVSEAQSDSDFNDDYYTPQSEETFSPRSDSMSDIMSPRSDEIFSPPLPSSPPSAFNSPSGGMTAEEEQNLRGFLRTLNIEEQTNSSPETVLDGITPSIVTTNVEISDLKQTINETNELKARRARKRAAIESHFLPLITNPRYLDIIKEEGSDTSDIERRSEHNFNDDEDDLDDDVFIDTVAISRKANAVFPKSQLDFNRIKAKSAFKPPPPGGVIREEPQTILVETKLIEPVRVEAEYSNWTSKLVETVQSEAEVVYLDSSSSSEVGMDLDYTADVDDDDDEQEIRIQTPVIGELNNNFNSEYCFKTIKDKINDNQKDNKKCQSNNSNNRLEICDNSDSKTIVDSSFSRETTPEVLSDSMTPSFNRQDSDSSTHSHSTCHSQSTTRYIASSSSPQYDNLNIDFSGNSISESTSGDNSMGRGNNFKTLRQICVEKLADMPFGGAILEELANVSESLGTLTREKENMLRSEMPQLPNPLAAATSSPPPLPPRAQDRNIPPSIPPPPPSPSPPPIPEPPKLTFYLGSVSATHRVNPSPPPHARQPPLPTPPTPPLPSDLPSPPPTLPPPPALPLSPPPIPPQPHEQNLKHNSSTSSSSSNKTVIFNDNFATDFNREISDVDTTAKQSLINSNNKNNITINTKNKTINAEMSSSRENNFDAQNNNEGGENLDVDETDENRVTGAKDGTNRLLAIIRETEQNKQSSLDNSAASIKIKETSNSVGQTQFTSQVTAQHQQHQTNLNNISDQIMFAQPSDKFADFNKRFSNIDQISLNAPINIIDDPKTKRFSNFESSSFESKKRIENGNVVFECSDTNSKKLTDVNGKIVENSTIKESSVKGDEKSSENRNGAMSIPFKTITQSTHPSQSQSSVPPPPLSHKNHEKQSSQRSFHENVSQSQFKSSETANPNLTQQNPKSEFIFKEFDFVPKLSENFFSSISSSAATAVPTATNKNTTNAANDIKNNFKSKSHHDFFFDPKSDLMKSFDELNQEFKRNFESTLRSKIRPSSLHDKMRLESNNLSEWMKHARGSSGGLNDNNTQSKLSQQQSYTHQQSESSENITKPILREDNFVRNGRSFATHEIRAPRISTSAHDINFDDSSLAHQQHQHNFHDHQHYHDEVNRQYDMATSRRNKILQTRQSMIDQTPITPHVSATAEGRRMSLPKEMHEKQLSYIRQKERDLQQEFERLEQERRKLEEEFQSWYDDSSIASTIQPLSAAEEFRRQMQNEFLSKVAEREERRMQKIVKISKPFDEVTVNPNAGSKNDLRDEFLSKVKERRTKLNMPSDSDWESGAESQPSESATTDSKNVHIIKVKVIEGDDVIEDTKQLPKHLKEFIEYSQSSSKMEDGAVTASEKFVETATSSSSNKDGELRRPQMHFIGLACAIFIVGWSVCRAFITNR